MYVYLDAVNFNLMDLTTKRVCVLLMVDRIVMDTCQCIHLCQHSFISSGVCEALMPVHPSGVCVPLHFAVFVHAPACFELVLVSLCSQRSSVVHMRVDPSCISCSAILSSSIVSGLSSPTLPCFYRIYSISVTGALPPFSVEAQGWVARICQPWEQSYLGTGYQLLWKLLDVWSTQSPFSDART